MKHEIQAIIDKIEDATGQTAVYHEALQMLKALITWEPKKYEPNYFAQLNGEVTEHEDSTKLVRLNGAEWPTKELAKTARDMTKRNNLILQYKQEKGFGDGDCYLFKGNAGWGIDSDGYTGNPELTFKTRVQAQEVINALRLNDDSD